VIVDADDLRDLHGAQRSTSVEVARPPDAST
jgi:hypothetical protein